ncbi:MAG: hypothetical protein ACSLFL_05940 [Alphaproteobacteria bacterium]
MSLAINSASKVPAPAPSFREKDAVCIDARAICATNAQPRAQHSFQSQQSHLYILAQMARQQDTGFADDVANAYRQSGIRLVSSTQDVRI